MVSGGEEKKWADFTSYNKAMPVPGSKQPCTQIAAALVVGMIPV